MLELTNQTRQWTFWKRFRTLFAIYFFFLIFDFTSSDELFPHLIYVIMKYYTSLWNWLVPWTGVNILHLSYPITVKPNGSGDTTFNYVLQLLWLVITVIIATVWALIDRKRPSYVQFSYWTRIVIRYYLAYMLFVYGFVKIIKLQFPFPSLVRLTETYGDSSPMGLAWTFIGYSTGYNIYIGGAEVLAGILLFFKRTTLLGALLAMTVMTNVFAMNLAYDIPVKIFSLNLLFIATWIAWKDLDRLVGFFITHEAVLPRLDGYPFKTKWKKIIQLSLKTIAIGFTIYSTAWNFYKLSKNYGDDATKPPLYGIYDVKSFSVNGKETLPLTTDNTRWKRMIVNYPGNVRITTMPDSINWMKLKLDLKAKTAEFTSNTDSTDHFKLKFIRPNKKQLFLEGKMRNRQVRIEFKRFDETQFPLIKTGFNWINEYPNNQ
ncbi:MAG: hypothetical protein EOO43_13410 [Flavobacterium sp.]|nr:MAG: hypothetical protein EOO43_13410 [Flavobacterium sp.]